MRLQLKYGQEPGRESRLRISGRPQGGARVAVHERRDHVLIGIGCTTFIREFETWIAAGNPSDAVTPESFSPEAPGSLVHLDHQTAQCTVKSDLAGCFPLFLRVLDKELWIGDRLSELKDDRTEPDWIGAIQYLRKAFTVGRRTLFKDIARIRPGERCEISLDEPEIRYSDASSLWANASDSHKPGTQLDAFCGALLDASDPGGPIRLMMSGGWDSRLLLAACLANGRRDDLTLYFHGDTESREASLVRQIARDLQLPLDLVEIRREMFSPEQLSGDFAHYESVSFPFWHHVRSIDRETQHQVMAGIFGEVPGGHYGPPTVLHGRQKMTNSLAWLLFPGFVNGQHGHNEGMTAALRLYRQAPYSLPWHMGRDAWQAHFAASHEQVEADIAAEMKRYQERGLRFPHEFVEAFITEHRGAQVIAAQLHSASRDGGFSAPFTHRKALEVGASTPFGDKAFNRMSQAAIRALRPKLLDYPIAATLCKASRPVAVLEGSRVLRKTLESLRRSKMLRRSSQEQDAVRLSWVRFGGIASSSTCHDVVDSLKLPIWDRRRMHDHLQAATPEHGHPMVDMLMKIKTLDLALTSDPGPGADAGEARGTG